MRAIKQAKILASIVVIFAVFAITLGSSGKAYASFPHCTWVGGGGDNNFSDAANWTGCGGAPPSGAGVTLSFDNSTLTQNEILNNDISSLTIHAINFGGTGTTYGFRIAGNPIIVNNASSIADNTTATTPSGFNDAIDINSSLMINLHNTNGTYFASFVGSGLPIGVYGDVGTVMQVGDLSGYNGFISMNNPELELMPTGDMTSTTLIHISSLGNTSGSLALFNQAGDTGTYTYNLRLSFDDTGYPAQINLLGGAGSKVKSVIAGEAFLYSDVTVNADGGNTLEITSDLSYDANETISSPTAGNTTVTVVNGDDQSAINPTVGANAIYQVDGILGDVTVDSLGTLKGDGTVASANVLAGGAVAPGHSPGCLTSNGNFTIAGTYDADIQGPGNTACADYDQLIVGGTTNLTGGSLNLNFLDGFTPAVGQTFEILKNTGPDPITGTFNNLPEGSIITVGNVSLRITYHGDGGNNVVLTVVRQVGLPDTGLAPPSSAGLVIWVSIIFSALGLALNLIRIPKLTR